MTERLSSGSTRFDDVLGGGLPTNAINLIIGPPGSGKTILAEQYLFRNATEERPGLFLSTVSEPFDKVLRYGESLAFFDADAIGTRVFYDDLGAALMAHGIEGLVDQIDGLLKEIRPGTIVIDSFKAIRAFASDEADVQTVPPRPRRSAHGGHREHVLDRRVRARGHHRRGGVRGRGRDYRDGHEANGGT